MTRRVAGERWYRRLLNLYPRDFRDEFGGEMTRLYRDRRHDEHWWSLWGSLLLDVLRTAPSEHLAILRQDVRHAWRRLRRAPIVTATAALTLALGVGASTAVFSVVYAILLRPLPYPDAGRLVELSEANLEAGFPSFRVSALNYLSWTERSTSFEAMGAFGSTSLTLTDTQDPELLIGSLVTTSLFNVLNVPPIVGRALLPEDEQRGSARTVVLSESLWRGRFGSDPFMVGRPITLDGERYQVVGVMPRTFREVGRSQAAAAADAQIFLPMVIDRVRENRGNHTLRVVGRLRRGVELEQARDEIRAVSAALEREFPATNTNWNARIERLSDTMLEPRVQRSLLLVLGAVIVVFLIACANVANLMLARGTQRRAELAVRTALGAGRSRLVRQLLTESCCLAALSGVAGVFSAAITYPLVRALVPPTLPRLDEMRLDLTVLAFGLVITIVSGIVFGVLPALRASRLDPSQSLMFVGRATTDSSRAPARQLLVAAQVALATTLLVGAALLLQGFVRLQRVPLGFEPNRIVTARITLPRSSYPDAGRALQFYQGLTNTLQAYEHLRSHAFATSAPFAPGVRAAFSPPALGRTSTATAETGVAAEHIVTGDYFQVLGIPLLAGRSFNERDTSDAVGVAVVSERLARRSWPDENPLGQTVERGGRSFEVIGVAGDIRGSDTQGARGGGPDRDPRAAVYFSASQLPQRTMTLLVRASGQPTGIVSTICEAVRQQDPSLAIQQVRPLRDWLVESVAPTRLATRLATLFALSALLLASVGIYGVLAYTVASRTREIGLRMAIGATRRSVIGLVLKNSMTWSAAGILVGLIGAFTAAKLIATLLFDVAARDPFTFVTVGGAVILVALAASAIPAMRAVQIDPAIAMRTE